MNNAKPYHIPTLLRWIPALSYAFLIFVASSLPQPVPYLPIPYIDKPIHLVEYGILCVLLCWALSAPSGPEGAIRPIKRIILISIITASLYGISDEVHQYFVPGRCASVGDWIADALGASAAGFFWYRWRVSDVSLPTK
jgi:VanZ family protein